MDTARRCDRPGVTGATRAGVKRGLRVVSVICVVGAVCDLGMSTTPCLAQSVPSATQTPPRPQFETRAELVLVDVNVVDREGHPVSDLNETDFEIEINGQPRIIQSVQFVSTLPDPSVAPSPRETAFSTNEAPTSGRLLLFVIDEGNMRVGSARTVLRAAQMLMDHLSPGDLVGLARLPTGVGGVEFTTNRERIAAALQRVTGSIGSRTAGSGLRISEASALESGDQVLWQQAIDRECAGEAGLGLEACVETLQGDARGMIMEAGARARTTLQALESLFERLRSVDAPVSVVMISEGLFVGRDRQDMNTLARRAAEARATVHIVRPSQSFFDIEDRAAPGLGSFFDDSLLSEGLEQLAAQTRGTLNQVSTGSGASVFERLGWELSGYYLIGFEPSEADRTGRERRIRVRVERRDVRVRARPTFVIRDPVRAATADAGGSTPTALVKQLLGAPLPTRGLPMRVATFTATSAGDSRVRVIIAAEIGEPATETGEWPIGLLVIDKDDKVVASSLDPATLAPSSARQPSPPLLLTSLLLEPGEYTLRLAAIGPDGRSGSVHHSIDARFRPGPGRLKISDLLLVSGPLGAAGPPKPTPSAVIETETAQAMIEMIGSGEQSFSRAQVRVQVATSEAGDALVSAEARSVSRGDSQRAFAATLRLGILPPGEYVARAIVSVPGEKETTTVRHFRLAPVAEATTSVETAAADGAAIDPDAPPAPPAPSRILAPVPKFLPELVVRREVVEPFLEGLLGLHPPSAAIATVVERARTGVYEAPDVDARLTEDDELTLAFIRGLAALEKNQVAQATAWFQQTAKGASDFLGAAFYLGACFAATGRDPEAIGAWQMALLSENPGAVYPLLVDALLRVGDGRQASEVLAEAPMAWADENERLRREATAEAMLGDFGAALPKLTTLIAETSDVDPSLLFMTIQVLYRLHVDFGGLDAANRARFAQYVAQYQKAGGPNLALVETWTRFVLK